MERAGRGSQQPGVRDRGVGIAREAAPRIHDLLAYGGPFDRDLEGRLAQAPNIVVPTITLEGDANGAPHPDATVYARKFTGKYAHRVIEGGVGHNLPQEAPQAFADAIIEVDTY